MKVVWKYGVTCGLLILMIGVASCQWFSGESDGPTSATVSGNAAQPGNFYVSRGIADQFGVYKAESGGFQVNIPTPGDYVLTYTTTLGTFEIVFRATEKALLNIGVQPGDDVLEASLQTGQITETAGQKTTVQTFGPVIVFLRPGSGTDIGWTDIFVVDTSHATIILIRNGSVTPGPLVIILPKPVDPGIPGASKAATAV